LDILSPLCIPRIGIAATGINEIIPSGMGWNTINIAIDIVNPIVEVA
jgi:hypothetical protein